MDELKEWLATDGFKFENNWLTVDINDCKWYAWRKTKLESMECDCNQWKGIQIIVKPYFFKIDGVRNKSVEVELSGEHKGVWFKIMAYSIDASDLPIKLPDIERSLINGWNALCFG